MPGDELDIDRGQMWLLWESDTPVGFCTARTVLGDPQTVFLSRSGILPIARGKGLQRRMIDVRLRWAREIGATTVVTYVLYDNWASLINLIKKGFKFYSPGYRWAGKDVHYLMREL